MWRLYYRQVAGQYLAVVNAETAGLEHEARAPLLTMLNWLSGDPDMHKLE